MGGFLLVGDYIFAYSYPLAFIGAMFYGIASLVNFEPSNLVANKNVVVFLNGFIGVCGTLALFNWFKNTQIPVIGPILLPNGTKVIKSQM